MLKWHKQKKPSPQTTGSAIYIFKYYTVYTTSMFTVVKFNA